jgi:hypothetical protein
MRVTVNKRRVLQRSRSRNQNVHCGDVRGRAGSQTNRFAPHGFIHVHNLTQQGAVMVQFCGAARCIHAELMQAQFKLLEAKKREILPILLKAIAHSQRTPCNLAHYLQKDFAAALKPEILIDDGSRLPTLSWWHKRGPDQQGPQRHFSHLPTGRGGPL